MDITGLRVQRHSGKPAPRNRLPVFKPGQIVHGKVNRILGKGYIQARIHGRDLVASSKISVSVDEQLLFRVIKLRPKPHLQVLQSLDRSASSTGVTGDTKLLKTFLEHDLPITQEMIRNFQDMPGKNIIRKFIAMIRENPIAWRRFLWNTTHLTAERLLDFGKWLEVGTKVFTSQFIGQLAERSFPEHILQLRPELFSMTDGLQQHLREASGKNVVGGKLAQQMETHWMQWAALREASWNGGAWYGNFLPFLWEEQRGMAAYSYWKPEGIADEVSPSRLSLISAFQNGWVLQFLLEYREKDIAGAIDVNETSLAMTVQDLLTSFRQDLRKNGFSQIGVRVNTVRDLKVDYTQLLPVEQESLAYAG